MATSSDQTSHKWYKGSLPGKATREQRVSLGYRRVIVMVGLILLIVSTWIAPPTPDRIWFILLMALFIAFQAIFPLSLLSGEISLTQVITLGGAMLYGPVSAGWAAVFGIGLGYAVRWFEERKWVQTSVPPPMDRLDALAMMGMQNIALLVALPAFGYWQGMSIEPQPQGGMLVSAAPVLLLFAAIHLALFLGNALAIYFDLSGFQSDLLMLFIIEVLPLPFIAIVAMGYPAIGLGSLILLGGVPTVLQMLIFGGKSVRVDLQRRAKELASLNQISQVMRTSLDLDQLLEEIHAQVSALFAVENFYIALYNQEEEQLWYPLAVKNSQRVYWPPRQLTDRLTDRVIRKRSPILLPHNARDALVRIGLPAGEDSPTAWMGVPLIASAKVIGCLGVFSFSPEVVFTSADVRWLTTLSGQVSVAIEHTLHYQRTQRRADLALTHRVYQLSILEAVSREMADAIRSDRLLDVILGYAAEVTRSEWGNISLYDPVQNLMLIKAVRGYQKSIASVSADHGITSRAIATSQRVYVPDVTQDPEYVDFSGGAARSQLTIPMVHEGRVLGVLTLESGQPNGYSASDQVFVSQLAAHATIAVVNANLYAQAQERLSELAAVINSVGEGLLVCDATGQVTLVNDALVGFIDLPAAEITGKSLAHLPVKVLAGLGISKEQAVSVVASLEEGIAPSLPRLTIKTGDVPAEKTLVRTAFTIGDRKGRISGWTVVVRNVTEEIQVAQARELISETLIHDLRSPASAVLGALDVLDEAIQHSPSGDDEVVHQAVEVARRGAQRVLGMIESLLEIARLHGGKIEVFQSDFNVRSLVTHVMSDFSSQALEYGVILRNEVPEDFPLARADLNKTTRVLTNLLDNALKFTPSGGQVILSAICQEDHLIALRVSDTGPGIPEEYREKIFERFTQVPGLVGRRRGSGLGLTFCRLAMEAQGGKIWVEPRPGGGSVFAITLPVAPGLNGQSPKNPGISG